MHFGASFHRHLTSPVLIFSLLLLLQAQTAEQNGSTRVDTKYHLTRAVGECKMIFCIHESEIIDRNIFESWNCVLHKSDITSFQYLYERVPQYKLSALPRQQKFVDNVEACAEACVKEQLYLCKSFDFDNHRKACLLYSEDHEDRDIRLVEQEHVDHYQSAYARLFDPIPKHRLNTWMNGQEEQCSVEQCARLCILEVRFKCESFNYDPVMRRCFMTEQSESEAYGVSQDPSFDYYRRRPDGALQQFVNMGAASLSPLTDIYVYDDVTRGQTLEDCAQECLDKQEFHCASFDYTHEGEHSLCQMSKYIAANVRGLRYAASSRNNHYERVEEELRYFYTTPYSVLLGNDLKTYNLVTPNRCARMCMQEEGFVCRSFDYQVVEGKCTLSDKTGSDVGGLYYGAAQEVHHFEMKPILDCGGNLTGPYGDLASPGWPRDYSHHEKCTWNITVPENKVISIQFTHLSIYTHSGKPCLDGDDRLVVSEAGTQSCIQPNTQYFTTQTNQALLTFYTNSEKDAQGFRAFYTADWTCNAHLTTDPGDFASPQWPNKYPPSMMCSWRISAPDGYSVRLYFTSFQLERHALGHCNEQIDHVKVLDGGSINDRLIGLYCGGRTQFDIKSTGTDLIVKFFSDVDRTAQGFHATFVFEPASKLPGDNKPLVPPDSDVIDLDKDGDETINSDEKVDGDVSSEEEKSSEESKESSEEYHVDVNPLNPARSASDQHYQRITSEYKTAMWGVITLLIILLTAVSVVLFLVWRHYKRKLRHLREIVVQEEPLLGHDPMTVTYTIKPNNVSMGNEVDLSQQGACGGAELSPANYEKYRAENIKNVNLDVKQYDEPGKCNIVGLPQNGPSST